MAGKTHKNGGWDISRRDFVKLGAFATAGGAMLGAPGDWVLAEPNPDVADQVVRTVRNLCVYCSLGCGVFVALDADDNVVDVYGDPNSITNNGRLCSKGRNMVQLVNGSQRIGIPGQTDHYKYGSSGPVTAGPMKKVGNGSWQTIGWDNAFAEIADRLKDAKESSPDKADAVCFFGSSHLNNEEAYLYKKLITTFGTNNSEHAARI